MKVRIACWVLDPVTQPSCDLPLRYSWVLWVHQATHTQQSARRPRGWCETPPHRQSALAKRRDSAQNRMDERAGGL